MDWRRPKREMLPNNPTAVREYGVAGKQLLNQVVGSHWRSRMGHAHTYRELGRRNSNIENTLNVARLPLNNDQVFHYRKSSGMVEKTKHTTTMYTLNTKGKQ